MSRLVAKLLLELNFQYKILTNIYQGWLLKALPGVNRSLQAGNFTETIFFTYLILWTDLFTKVVELMGNHLKYEI